MKLGICIPYRNRKQNLKILLKDLGRYLESKNIEHKFYIAHQIDKKLFNRGAMKNIAAKHAFEDGCDYIAWHDVDMIPSDNTADYSYPEKYPIHIATNLSKFNNGMRYEQYFGGVVIFNKKQVLQINGYSNKYWDWGQEDDDIFWRCYYEKLVDVKKLVSYDSVKVCNFNGDTSSIAIYPDRDFLSLLNNSHTISILAYPEHNKKHPIYLIGDPNKKFIEYPILRKENFSDWGISFNNSNAISYMFKDVKNNFYYDWGKRQDRLWTWITISYDKENNSSYFFINDELIHMENDVKKNVGIQLEAKLKYLHSLKPFYLGLDVGKKINFKGKIASIRVHNDVFSNIKNKAPQYYWDASLDNFGNLKINYENIKITKQKIDVIKSILPHRRAGKFKCLPHKDEGIKNGEWIKKENTARNEQKLMNKLQSKKLDYKNDGINTLRYSVESLEVLSDKAVMINVHLNFNEHE